MSLDTENLKGQNVGRLAWSLALFAIGGSLIAFAIGIFFLVTTGDSRTVDLDDFLVPIPTAAYAIVGGLVASRHPRNPIGWIFIAVSWLYGFDLTRDIYQAFAPEIGVTGSLPALADNLWIPRILLPTLFVFLLFPDGAHLSPRWGIVFWLAVLGLAGQHVALALHPGPVPFFDVGANPDGIPTLAGLLDIVLQITRLLLLIGLVGSISAFVIRIRRSQGVERQQMKWLTYAIGLMLLSFAFGTLTWSLWPDNQLVTGLSGNMTELSVLGIAVATGIAILRHRLYDIDLVINRTLVYGALTISVVAIYALLVVGLGTLIQAEDSLLISLVATGLIAVIFQPLRERLQRAVNRLTFGDRDEPFEAFERLGRRLEAVFSPEMVYPTIVETVAQALKLPYVAIAMQHGEALEIAEAYGRASHEPLALAYPLLHQGEVVGQLLVGRRSPDENFTEADERLLRGFARQAGTAVHAVQLTADLQRSRQQLVTAREEERLRLRRDLHDGLGPTLAALHVQANALRRVIHRDPEAAEAMLEEFNAEIRGAIDDIRRVVYALRPPTLDELGLVGAARVYAFNCSREAGLQADHNPGDRRVPVLSVLVESTAELSPLPAAVEVAAYHVVREALTNVVHHAQASQCRVSFQVDDALIVEITDDGIGLPTENQAGVGLLSMRERAEELGGTFTIEPNSGGGTRVRAKFPLMET